MAVTAEIKLQGLSKIGEAFALWEQEGWRFEINGEVHYLPLGDTSWTDWRAEKMPSDALHRMLQVKENLGEAIGMEMQWKHGDYGILLLYQRESMATLSVIRQHKMLRSGTGKESATDWNWYVDRLVQKLVENELITGYRLEESWY